MVDYQMILTVVIIIALVLVGWAKVTGQTIRELLDDLRGFGSDIKEDSQERLTIYE